MTENTPGSVVHLHELSHLLILKTLQGRYVLISILWWGSWGYSASKWLSWDLPKSRLLPLCYSATHSAPQCFPACSRNVYSGKYWINTSSIAQNWKHGISTHEYIEAGNWSTSLSCLHDSEKNFILVFSAILTHSGGWKAKLRIHWNFHFTASLWLRKLAPQNTTDTSPQFMMSEPCWVIWMQAGISSTLWKEACPWLPTILLEGVLLGYCGPKQNWLAIDSVPWYLRVPVSGCV